MISPTELRIGNYIYDDFQEVHIVEKIESQKYNDWNGSDPSLVVFSKLKDTYDGMYTCDVVSGIPLNKDWLSKVGNWADDFYSGFLISLNEKSSIRIMKDDEGWYWYSHCNYVRLQYIHQLQNLYFALTGTELELKK